MLVSIIVTTKNEEINIKNCLESIAKQSFPAEDTEIIVVDNNSADRTKEIAKKYTKKVFDYGPERSAQRNFGVEKASGKYVFYLDADMILSENLVSESADLLEKNKNIVALYIPEIVAGKNFWNKVRRFERSFYDGTVIDAVRFIRKEVFLNVGGFDENLTGPEDWDFDKKIRKNGKTGLIKSPLYHNEKEFNLRKYIRKKVYYAKDFEKYIAKWGKNDPDIRKQFSFFYRFFGVFMENGRWKKLFFNPRLAISMYFLRFLVGFNYLLKR